MCVCVLLDGKFTKENPKHAQPLFRSEQYDNIGMIDSGGPFQHIVACNMSPAGNRRLHAKLA